MCQWFHVGQILFIKQVEGGNEREINTQGIKYNKNNQVLLKINTMSYMLVEELRSHHSTKTNRERPPFWCLIDQAIARVLKFSKRRCTFCKLRCHLTFQPHLPVVTQFLQVRDLSAQELMEAGSLEGISSCFLGVRLLCGLPLPRVIHHFHRRWQGARDGETNLASRMCLSQQLILAEHLEGLQKGFTPWLGSRRQLPAQGHEARLCVRCLDPSTQGPQLCLSRRLTPLTLKGAGRGPSSS